MIARDRLDGLYDTYNYRKWVHPDPLEFLYDYPDVLDREIVGFISSSLAYGRVAQILRSVACVVEKMGPSPRSYLESATSGSLRRAFRGFRHRFTTSRELVQMLQGLQGVMRQHGSLYQCVLHHMNPTDDTVLKGLSALAEEIAAPFQGKCNSLVPLPQRGSACKRLHLFLRWMVRQDRVDPGGWPEVPAAKLVVPLDTHMYRISFRLGLTARKQADLRTALEVTRAFRTLLPHDPVRYDFALSRLGIRQDAFASDYLDAWEGAGTLGKEALP
jgi:uncharacterized protein (TIGR02757 family)